MNRLTITVSTSHIPTTDESPSSVIPDGALASENAIKQSNIPWSKRLEP